MEAGVQFHNSLLHPPVGLFHLGWFFHFVWDATNSVHLAIVQNYIIYGKPWISSASAGLQRNAASLTAFPEDCPQARTHQVA